MISKLLKRFGYIKPDTLSEDELTILLVKLFDNPFDYRIEKDVETKLFGDLSAIDGLREYLRAVEASDIKSYFGADTETKRLIKGAYLRTKHLRSKLVKKGTATQKNVVAKLTSPRHA